MNIFEQYSLLKINTKRILLSATFLIIGTQLSYSQKILYGKVLNGTTHQPIPNVTLRVNKSLLTTHSDENGKYMLRLPKNITTVTVSSMGYERVEIPQQIITSKSEQVEYDIKLYASALSLSEAVVTAHNEARALRESAMPVSVITAKDLQGTCSSINEVIARTTGITIRNTGGVGSASRISVRGLEGKRMGLFIEDMPTGELNDYMTLNDIPTDMIERVEVYKGIVPYKFGGNAMGGAVNVVLKEYPPLYGDVGYEVSSYNTHRFNTVFKRNNQKLGLEYGCGGFYTHSDNSYKMRLMNIDDRRVRRDHDKYDKYVIGGSMIATKWWFDEIKTELSYIHNKQEIQGIDYDIREAYNKSDMFVNEWILKKKNFLLPGLDFDYSLLFSLVNYGKTDIAKNRYDWDGNKYAPVSAYGGETGSFPTDGDNHSQNHYSKLNLNYILNKTHSFNLNVYGNYIYQNPKDELMDKALAFKANFPNRMGSVTTGFSYDLHLLDGRLQSATTIKNYHYRTKTKMSDLLYLNEPQETRINKTYWGWSEALRYKFTKDFLVKASFSNEMRIPTNEELIGNGYSVLPSPSLTPEKNKAVNIGLLYRKNTSNGIVEAEVNGFYSALEDMVRFTPDMLPTMARYRNFGKVTTKGVEGEIKGDVCSWLYLYVNATYQDLRDVRKTLPGTSAPNPSYDMRMPNIPYFLANSGMEIHKRNLFGGSGQNTRFLIDASYIHEYFYDFEMSKNQERKIPTSLTFDGAIEHSFMNNRLFVTLKVKNITDREIYSELNRPLPGRQLGIKLRYLFK